MRITGPDLACGMVSYFRVDEIGPFYHSNDEVPPKMGKERKNRAYSAFCHNPSCKK